MELTHTHHRKEKIILFSAFWLYIIESINLILSTLKKGAKSNNST